MPTAGDGDHAVRLREDASGWRRVNGPRLTPDEPVLDGLTEAEAESLVENQWALVYYETETCTTVKADGDVCGRDLPCPYHSDSDTDDESEE